MHRSIPGIVLMCLFGCSSAPEPKEEATIPSAPEVTEPRSWTGYYSGSSSIGDGTVEEVAMWVRADSTFILQRKIIGQDSVPTGTFGRWHDATNVLELGTGETLAARYTQGENGSLRSHPELPGQPVSVLDKFADALGDAVPHMRVSGTYVLADDAQSFKPCGSTYTWPCVGGMDTGEEDGESLNPFTNEDMLKAYRKAVKKDGDTWEVMVICTLGMGPAMEGTGTDEYLFIESVTGDSHGCP